MLPTNGETTMTESLEWQLTTKGWRNRSCSVWSSASPPFFAAEPSAAQQKSRGSAWLLPRGTPRPRPPFPLWLPPPQPPAQERSQALQHWYRQALDTHGSLVVAQSLLGKTQVIKHELLSTGNAPQLTHKPPQSITWPSRARKLF